MNSTGSRWFLKYGEEVLLDKGFKSKEDASKWIDSHPDFEWRAGYVFRFYGDKYDREIVSRKGTRAKN